MRYKKEREYTEHYLEVFSTAVQSRLRTNEDVGAEISGGLDSSNVLATLQYCVENGSVRHNFRAYSLSYPGQSCDESDYAKAIGNKLSCHIHMIDGTKSILPDWDKQVDRSWLPPDPPNLSNSNLLNSRAKDDGVNVILTGLGGDDWFEGHRFPYYNLLTHKDLKGFFREMRYDFSHNKKQLLVD